MDWYVIRQYLVLIKLIYSIGAVAAGGCEARKLRIVRALSGHSAR
jgi:hypothetical protein